MKQIMILPMRSVVKGDADANFAVGVYQMGGNQTNWSVRGQDGKGFCDMNDGAVDCDKAVILFGTDDERETLFCARHFFTHVHGDESSASEFVAGK